MFLHDSGAGMVCRENLVESYDADQYYWVYSKLLQIISFFFGVTSIKSSYMDVGLSSDWFISLVDGDKTTYSVFGENFIPLYVNACFKI